MATNAELTVQYNTLATQLGLPSIGLWKNKKDILESKIADLQKQVQDKQLASAAQALNDDRHEEPVTEEPVKETKAPKTKKTAKVKKTPDQKTEPKSVEIVVEFLRAGIEKGDNPTAVLRLAHKQWPDMTRIQFKHSAKEAGINPLTARNLFDRLASKGAQE